MPDDARLIPLQPHKIESEGLLTEHTLKLRIPDETLRTSRADTTGMVYLKVKGTNVLRSMPDVWGGLPGDPNYLFPTSRIGQHGLFIENLHGIINVIEKAKKCWEEKI